MNKLTKVPAWCEHFLAKLSDTGNVSKAAEHANITRARAYQLRSENDAFAEAWKESLAKAVDSLVEEAFRRGRDGYEKPVFQGGNQVGTVREYSDRLLIKLLEAHDPRFRPGVEVKVKDPMAELRKALGITEDGLMKLIRGMATIDLGQAEIIDVEPALIEGGKNEQDEEDDGGYGASDTANPPRM